MGRLKTITTQFINGNPKGVRVCLRTLSPITTVVVPRPLMDEARTIELPSHGVYYLIDDEDGRLSRLYIGQTTQGILRLEDHKVKKEFWNKAILFLADSSVLTLDLISALERYAIEKAQESKRYSLENKINPKCRIDQYQKPIVEEVYEEIGFILSSLGYDMEDAREGIAREKILYTSRRGVKASGVYTGDEFVVLDGSPIDVSFPAKLEKYNQLRKALVESGDLSEDASGIVRLAKSIAFDSPSGAADFVLGGSNNGWVEWRDGEGRTMDGLYRR
ncbi:GIY-YIG nuclease family protein [Raoultibacter phocaeensis]|uniref:GIY-YIG nuclease family protein n=1 Tax=Raoultibacter phocaeensis TaxID=2479841 RepID=UPI00111B5D3C|nr:GIY-YIG nuclease family protein [Raoultibacter phocaeensis]